MHTKDFRVLESTCQSYKDRTVTAVVDAGTELNCTATLDEQTVDYGFSYWLRYIQYCVGWWDSTSSYTCNIISTYNKFASTRVSADKDGIRCSVARVYRDRFSDYYDYTLRRYDIPIKIRRKGKKQHCTRHPQLCTLYCIDVVDAHSCVVIRALSSVYLDSYIMC